jgi:hypothetical protein
MTRQASIRSLIDRGAHPPLGVIADLYTLSAKASILMIIFDSVTVARAKNHRIGDQIIKIESDRFDWDVIAQAIISRFKFQV